MPLSRVSPGQSIDRSAARENAVVESVNWTESQRVRQQFAPPSARVDPGLVHIFNNSEDDYALFDAVELSAPPILPSDSVSAWLTGLPAFSGVTPTGSHGRFAVLIEPCAESAGALAVVSGVVRTIVDMLDAAHTRAKITSGSRRLQSTDDETAPCLILWVESGTGEKYASVRLDGGGGASDFEDVAQIEIATLTGTLAYGGNTTATISGAGSVDVYDWVLSTGQTIASGKKVVIGYRLTDSKWYVIAAQCP